MAQIVKKKHKKEKRETKVTIKPEIRITVTVNGKGVE